MSRHRDFDFTANDDGTYDMHLNGKTRRGVSIEDMFLAIGWDLTYKETQILVYNIVRTSFQYWLELCHGEKETPDCNFSDLEKFFRSDCAGYTGHEFAMRVLDGLLEERKRKLGY